MGRIAVVLKNEKVPAPKLNNRLTCELCENIHIHYRNMRIEFTKDEFVHILRLLNGIDINEVENFHYSDWAYKELIKDFGLPDETYYDHRLQIEQQMEGHFHIHYRNLRLEFNKLTELGFPKYFGTFKLYKYRFQKLLHRIKMGIISHIHKPKKFSKLNKLNLKFDQNWLAKNSEKHYYTYQIKKVKLKNIKSILLTKDGWHTYKLCNTPEFKFLQGDQQTYIDYCDYKNPRADGEVHSVQRYNELILKLEQDGFNDDNCIILNEKNEIIDGKHRACWLLNKYGKDRKIKVLKIYCKRSFRKSCEESD